MLYQTHYRTQPPPQSMPMEGTTQVQNSAGGYVWPVNDWVRLDRFLVLGAEGGSYYASERKLTLENAQAVRRCIEADGLRVVQRIVEISQAGRAPKNDPALFALAMCAGLGGPATRSAALEALPQVARIGTHLFHFLAAVEAYRGWGRGLRRAVARWYSEMPADRLAYQAVKYQQRDGWGHRDALRLAHPRPATPQREAIYGWMVNGWSEVGATPDPDAGLRLLWAYERGMRAVDVNEVIDLVATYNLPWEALPTQWLAQADVWQALLPTLPMTALLRNLARMTANGLLTTDAPETATVVERLTQVESLRRARIHPIAVLAALMTYRQGQSARGSLKWKPVAAINEALEQAFYLAFGNVEPTGKRLVLALDVSGSMGGGEVAGVPGLTPRVASTAMALATAAVEPQHTIVAFSQRMVKLDIRPDQRLDKALRLTDNLPFGGTDCALPMLWALENGVEADAFVVYTDSETWFGQVHPAQALADYRQETGIPAKLVVVGMVSNGFSIANPNDAGMLDVVGFDTATPQVIADFVAG